MRIAFVYDGAYPWINGGAEKGSMRLVKDSLRGDMMSTGTVWGGGCQIMERVLLRLMV